MAAELEKENYRGKDQINKREREILTRWDELLVLLERHRLALQSASQLMSVMRDLDTVASTIRDLEVRIPAAGHRVRLFISSLFDCRKTSNRKTSAVTCWPPRIWRNSTTYSSRKSLPWVTTSSVLTDRRSRLNKCILENRGHQRFKRSKIKMQINKANRINSWL